MSSHFANLLLSPANLLPIFLTTTLLLALTMLIVSILALHNPTVFAQNFGLLLPAFKSSHDNDNNNTKDRNSPLKNAINHENITSNTSTAAEATNPVAWLIPFAAREMALSLSILVLLYLEEYRAVSVLVVIIGVVVGAGDSLATIRYGRVGSWGQHAWPSVVVAGLGITGWIICLK